MEQTGLKQVWSRPTIVEMDVLETAKNDKVSELIKGNEGWLAAPAS